jgi:DNA-binding transcriptional ArsR family regulator
MTDDDAEEPTATDATGDGPAPDPSTVADGQVAALAALGNERRLEILLALGDRERETRVDRYELTFTELYEAVDVESTSQFSYHLSQLVGPFVAETDGGYHLTYSGDRIVRAVRSGVYEPTDGFDPVAVEGGCPACGAAALEAILADERFVVRCTDCARRLLSESFPRSQAAERTPTEVVESFGYRIWSTYVLIRGDVCPECYGRTRRRVDSHESDSETLYTFASICETCDFTIHLPVEVPVVFHPAALEFLWRHGVSVLDSPLWHLFALFSSTDWTTDVRSTEPLEARFSIALDGDELELAMDDTLTVSPVDRPDIDGLPEHHDVAWSP